MLGTWRLPWAVMGSMGRLEDRWKETEIPAKRERDSGRISRGGDDGIAGLRDTGLGIEGRDSDRESGADRGEVSFWGGGVDGLGEGVVLRCCGAAMRCGAGLGAGWVRVDICLYLSGDGGWDDGMLCYDVIW